MKKTSNFFGFTLIEMLIVISILSVLGVLILTIFTRTLKGNNKSQIIESIKQNGQSVLEIMDKTIRDSDNAVCISPDNKNLVVVKNGIYARYRFIAPVVSPSSNGFIQQDNPDRINVEGSNPVRKETDSELVSRVCGNSDPMPNAITLTDTNSQTGVSVENGLFTRDKSAGYKDQVTIKFDLWPGKGAPQSVTGQIDPVSFQTTIQLR